MNTDATPAALALALRAAKGTVKRSKIAEVEIVGIDISPEEEVEFLLALHECDDEIKGAVNATSRHNLLARLPSVGVRATERRGAHGKRILVLRYLPGVRRAQ